VKTDEAGLSSKLSWSFCNLFGNCSQNPPWSNLGRRSEVK